MLIIEKTMKALLVPTEMQDADLKTICAQHGLLPTAWMDVRARYSVDCGESLGEWLTRMKPQVPHWYPAPEIGDGVPAEILEAAFGAKPTMTARGQLSKLVDAATYQTLATAWNADTSLRPGRDPKGGTEKTEKTEEHKQVGGGPTNPWSVNFKGTDAERNVQIANICKTGTKFAEGLAKAAGTTIGRPLRRG
jgi:hypothetical protein